MWMANGRGPELNVDGSEGLQVWAISTFRMFGQLVKDRKR